MRRTWPVLMALFLIQAACTKQQGQPLVSLALQVEGRLPEIEWAEISGEFLPATGALYIMATGINDSRFYLQLRNVNDTGLVMVADLKEMYYVEFPVFVPVQLAAGRVYILRRNASGVYGRFEVLFTDGSNDSLRLSGSFSIRP